MRGAKRDVILMRSTYATTRSFGPEKISTMIFMDRYVELDRLMRHNYGQQG